MQEDLNRIKGVPAAPASSMPQPKITSPVPPSSAPRSIEIPSDDDSDDDHKSKKVWWILAAVVLAGISIILFYFIGRDSKPEQTPTPTETIAPTPTPIGFETVFSANEAISDNIDSFINTQNLAVGEIRTFRAESLEITFPADLERSLDLSEKYVTVFGKPDGTKGRGFAVRVIDQQSVQSTLTAWETTISRDLGGWLKINTQRSATAEFMQNTYQNVLIRYRNFPDAFNSIDYAVVGLPDGSYYLFVTNTRDHMFSVIDRTSGFVLGK